MPTWTTYSPGTTELAKVLAPSRTALVLIDFQNDFGHRDGVMGKTGVDMSCVPGAVAQAQALIDAAHGAGAPVVFVSLQTTIRLDSRPATLRRERIGQPYAEATRVCRKGGWGADWYGIAPTPQDYQLEKARYSSFQGTELDLQLRALGVDTLVVGGLTTECCVETAVRDAFHRDYHVFLAEDASASYDPELHAASVRTMSLFHALIVRSADVAAAWGAAARAAAE